jgi:hypothetical protein
LISHVKIDTACIINISRLVRVIFHVRNCKQPEGRCDEEKKDLRSRGLCLVPVSCTLDVGVDVIAGPADYWGAAPAFGMGFGQ